MSTSKSREARKLMAETGWNYTRALREVERRRADVKAENGSEDWKLQVTRTLDGDPAGVGIERRPFPEAVFVAPDPYRAEIAQDGPMICGPWMEEAAIGTEGAAAES